MPRKIKLTVSEGSEQEKEFVFQKPTRPVVGRADDCDIRFPMQLEHMDVSRHHCLFEIDPPTAKVRDLGSRNGTFVNGQKIGERPREHLPLNAGGVHLPPKELKDGDEVRVGKNIIRVEMIDS